MAYFFIHMFMHIIIITVVSNSLYGTKDDTSYLKTTKNQQKPIENNYDSIQQKEKQLKQEHDFNEVIAQQAFMKQKDDDYQKSV